MIETAQRSERAGGGSAFSQAREPHPAERITIVPATMDHARAIELREGDAREVAAYGLTSCQAIGLSLDRSLWAETYLVDGVPAAVMGLASSALLGGHGVPRLLTSPLCERHKRFFMCESRRQVDRMRATVLPLVNYVHADYARASRWLAWLGFTVEPPSGAWRRIIMEA